MNDEQTEDEMPYSCEKWIPCALSDGHDGPCLDDDGNQRPQKNPTASMRERWNK